MQVQFMLNENEPQLILPNGNPAVLPPNAEIFVNGQRWEPGVNGPNIIPHEPEQILIEQDRLAQAGCVTCGALITKSKHRTGMHCYKHDWNLKNIHRESQRRYLQSERGRATQARYLANRNRNVHPQPAENVPEDNANNEQH